MILGIDEVGRGPWAGPLVVGAVVLADEIPGLNDSKKLTKKKREALDVIIREKAAGFGLGWVHADELDELGMSAALRLATRRAVEQISAPYREIIIDGTINFLADTGKGKYVTTMPKADGLIPSVSAASIIAKVARDAFMTAQDELYPAYAFGKHAGYGTAFHREAIDRHGVTPLHRLSFAPLVKYRSTSEAPSGPTTRDIANASESIAARYLQEQGYEIIVRNWRNRYAEIDIIAHKDDEVFFIEVKHRKDDTQGGGSAVMTPARLRQLSFAAQMYASRSGLLERPLRLVLVTTKGITPAIDELIELS